MTWRLARAAGCVAAVLLLFSAAPVPAGEQREPAAETRLRNVLECMRRGRRLEGAGDYLHAAIEFEKVLVLDPANTAAAERLRRCEKMMEKR